MVLDWDYPYISLPKVQKTTKFLQIKQQALQFLDFLIQAFLKIILKIDNYNKNEKI